MSFFMRSLLRTIPLIGALLLSTAPVHASKTSEEITKPCETSEAAREACLGSGFFFAALSGYTLLCDLRDTGEMTPKVFARREKISRNAPEEEFEKVMWNEGVKLVLLDYPNCPIKPVR